MKELLPKAAKRVEQAGTENKRILVLGKHKNYDQLNIKIFEGNATKDGKIKNPLTEGDPLKHVWAAEQVEQAKFFTAITNFQNNFDAS